MIKGFFRWLYFNEPDLYGYPVKLIQVKSINCFLIDENFHRKTVSIIWNWQRFKYIFWIRPYEAVRKHLEGEK